MLCRDMLGLPLVALSPQTVMLGGIPPSIHGGARKVASHDMLVCSLRLVFRRFNQL